jgi:hypothetical protein
MENVGGTRGIAQVVEYLPRMHETLVQPLYYKRKERKKMCGRMCFKLLKHRFILKMYQETDVGSWL